MSTVAYALRAEYLGDVERVLSFDAAGQPAETETVPLFLGGVVSLDDDRDLNVAEELERGNGRIVLADSDLVGIAALDNYLPLKRVGSDDDAELSSDRYGDAGVPELDAELKRRGITGLNATKARKVAALHSDDARVAAGIPVPSVYTVEALTAADDTEEA